MNRELGMTKYRAYIWFKLPFLGGARYANTNRKIYRKAGSEARAIEGGAIRSRKNQDN